MNIKNILLLGLFGCLSGISTLAYSDDSDTSTSKEELSSPAPYIPDGTRNRNPGEGKLKGQTLRIKRSLLMVKDLKRSLDFYENVIGLEVYAVDQVYYNDQTTLGNKLFNTPHGTHRRLAQLNTSTEARGLALREINAEFTVPQEPRIGTILFEASDILGIAERAKEAGAEVITPAIVSNPAVGDVPESRFMELGVVDPDGHVLAFFKYFENTEKGNAEWEEARKKYKLESSN